MLARQPSVGTDLASASSVPHVLVIDDDPAVLALLIQLLARDGYRVEVTADGTRGLDLVRSGRYAAVVLDHQLPGLTGLDVLDRMQADGLKTPVIVLTGRGDEEVAFAAAKLGACRYLTKPFRPDELMQAIGTAVALGRADVETLAASKARLIDHRDGYSRWTRAMLAAIGAPHDPRTVELWAECVNASPSALRSWCQACQLPVRRSLLLARVLRAVIRSRELGGPIESFLDVADHRTLRRLFSLAAIDGWQADVRECLRCQQLVRDPAALQDLERVVVSLVSCP